MSKVRIARRFGPIIDALRAGKFYRRADAVGIRRHRDSCPRVAGRSFGR